MNTNCWIMRHTALVAAFALAACGPTVTPTVTAVPQSTTARTNAPTATTAPATAAATVVATPAAGVTLNLWHAYTPGSTEEQAINQIVAEYMKDDPNVTVAVREIPFGQIFSKWQSDVLSGGTAVDMLTLPNDSLGDWVRMGVVAPLDTRLAGQLMGISQSGIDGVTVDGHIYAVPGIIKAVALVYNKSTIPTPPATTDDLMALVASGKKIVINQSNYYVYGWFPAFGGTLMDATGKCIADQGGYVDAMQYLVDLKRAGADFETDSNKVDSLFETGKADMVIEGPWALGDIEKALSADKVGVAPLPAGPKGPARPLSGIDGFYINPNSHNQDTALALAQYIFSAQGLKTYADVAGDPPARTDVAVADPLVKAYAEAASAGTPRPQTKEFDQWWAPFNDLLTNVVQGQQTPADGVKAACAAMNKLNNK